MVQLYGPSNGGSAFPKLERLDSPSHEYTAHSTEGMTLRDYFAANMLPVLAYEACGVECDDRLARARALAQEAYEYADAMLAERAK